MSGVGTLSPIPVMNYIDVTALRQSMLTLKQVFYIIRALGNSLTFPRWRRLALSAHI